MPKTKTNYLLTLHSLKFANTAAFQSVYLVPGTNGKFENNLSEKMFYFTKSVNKTF